MASGCLQVEFRSLNRCLECCHEISHLFSSNKIDNNDFTGNSSRTPRISMQSYFFFIMSTKTSFGHLMGNDSVHEYQQLRER